MLLKTSILDFLKMSILRCNGLKLDKINILNKFYTTIKTK